ncbi:glucose PTS transporter subunit EIIB [Desnuesiella massiliensis]|uniref:glucose PTS transporter subunit EIIB n=1 Tax=Desnuesiella massiliensis TaxID=1650662 RepID=UPI0006E2BB24|nr:glucose PTS transporter subunit EIIB [Desnuesiella massiliensis]
MRGSAGNLIEFTLMNWIPLWPNHHAMFIKQIIIGLVFMFIWFGVFYFLIKKFDIKTPGREDMNIKLYSKSDYKEKMAKEKGSLEDVSSNDANTVKAIKFLSLLGGKANIEFVTNCASRLRVKVKDEKLVASAENFKEVGAHGLVEKGNAFQIIVGLDVPIVRERFEELIKEENLNEKS